MCAPSSPSGDQGDFVWWDLAELHPLLRIPPVSSYVTAMAVHPEQSWAMVGVEGDSGQVHLLDLAAGNSRPWWPWHADAISIDREGNLLAIACRRAGERWIAVFDCRGGPPQQGARPLHEVPLRDVHWPHLVFGPDGASLYCSELPRHFPGRSHVRIVLGSRTLTRGEGAIAAFASDGTALVAPRGRDAFAVAADGNTMAELPDAEPAGSVSRAVARLRPSPARWDLGVQLDGWLDRVAAAPSGIVVASDVQGQLHVLGPEPGRHRIASAHRGIATGLCWSPDSRYLAVQGMGALRIVERTGRAVLDLPGTHAVAAGSAGPEFWIADHAGM